MSLYRRGGVWWIDVYIGENRKRVRKSTGTDEKVKARIIEQAVVAANKHITTKQRALSIIDNVMLERDKCLALYEAPEFYRSSALDEGKSMTENSLKHRVALLSKFAMWAHDNSRIRYVEEVDATLAYSFVKTLPKNITAKTKNDYIGDLGTAWKLFMRHDKAKFNPWSTVRFQRNRNEETTGRAFTQDEINRLLIEGGKVGHDWQTAMFIGLYTGLRQGDATSLKWSDVDFSSKVISYEPGKTKKHGIKVRIPLHKTLAQWLEAHRNGSEWITPDRRGRVGKSRFYDGDKTFQELLALAKVEDSTGRDKLTFHCFRHTFVSRLAEAGVAQDVRMRLAGHTSTVNHAIYTHDDVSTRTAIDALPEVSYTV